MEKMELSGGMLISLASLIIAFIGLISGFARYKRQQQKEQESFRSDVNTRIATVKQKVDDHSEDIRCIRADLKEAVYKTQEMITEIYQNISKR